MISLRGVSYLSHSLSHSLEHRVQVIAHRMRLIVPDEPTKEMWDWLIILLVFYNAIEVPFDLAFKPSSSVALTVFDIMVDVTFVCDMIVR